MKEIISFGSDDYILADGTDFQSAIKVLIGMQPVERSNYTKDAVYTLKRGHSFSVTYVDDNKVKSNVNLTRKDIELEELVNGGN